MKKNHKQHNGEFTDKYTEASGIAKKLINSFFAAVTNLIPPDTQSIKEVGCGAGFSMEHIKRAVPDAKLCGSDIDPVLVEMARKKNPGVSFETESIYELPDADNSYDVVICLEVLEHLENPKAALKELCRISKSKVIISTPREPIWCALNMARGKYWTSLGNTPGHINHWSSRGLRTFVSSELTVQDVRTPLPWTVVLAKKI